MTSLRLSSPWDMPMSVLKAENIFEKVIAIKYDVPNDPAGHV